MDKPRNYFAGTYHHLLNRGVNKNIVFFTETDYLYFIRKIRKYKEVYKISILCYCLMPNHFHIFAKQVTDQFTIGKFISDLTNSYSRYINEKFNRSGSLFEGRTKNKLIEKEEYFLWLCYYIFNNPVKAKLCEKPENWNYSDCKDYLGIRNGTLSDKNEILDRFKNRNEFYNFITNKNYSYSIEEIFP